jgi:hypothetical protein
MKKQMLWVLLLGISAFFNSLSAQNCQVAVTNWYHAGERDWVTIVGAENMEKFGYTQPILVYKASAIKNEGMVAVYRWNHEGERDWATLPETYATDEDLLKWGYKNKTFLFYAYQKPVKGTIRVNLWYHPIEKDYVSLPTDYGTDAGLIQSGYEKRTNGYFYAFPK